jgi:2-polyprenyl-6-hydroxyphenyl methylase/3-demethylubiquinone-9 3-methyltransferase
MQDNNRNPVRIATLFHINLMPLPNIHHPLVEWLDWRVKILHCALLVRELVHYWPIYTETQKEHMETGMQGQQTTVDPSEIAKFEAMAAEWWDPKGKFKPLHMLNPCRLDYITQQIAGEFDRDLSSESPFDGLRILDIGCGGGLLCEPMARLGATVVGADAAERNIPVARVHAEQSGLTIDYRHTTAEAMAAAGEQFDVVLNMEVVEHVADPLAYLTACQQLLRPGGLHICSTINRNPKSFAMAIVGAEYVMRWLPKGTHEWSKFITPDELFDLLAQAGLNPVDRKGFVFNPVLWSWSISARDLSVNYVTASLKPE